MTELELQRLKVIREQWKEGQQDKRTILTDMITSEFIRALLHHSDYLLEHVTPSDEKTDTSHD